MIRKELVTSKILMARREGHLFSWQKRNLPKIIGRGECHTTPPSHASIPGHPDWAKWAGPKHDDIGLARARPGTKDSGPCWPETRTGPFSGLTCGPPCQARHNPFGQARLGPMVSLISPARHDPEKNDINYFYYII
jgi:hypothetical protein